MTKTTSSNNQHPIKILQVVGGMNQAGTETWLMNILRNIDRDRFQMDFLVHSMKPSAYEEEIIALGSRIIPCLSPSQPLLYASNFKKILQKYGPYDIVHSHVHHFSGYVLRLAKQAGVGICIAHSHNDTSAIQAKASWSRRFYLALMKRWIDKYATFGLTASHQAAPSLFGSDWKNDSRWQVLYCGIDLIPFTQQVDPIKIRTDLGIPDGALVIGHVGRFELQKNHDFLIDIAAKIIKQEPNTRFLLIGDGSLRKDIEQKAALLGLADQIIFTGTRSDIPQLMLGAIDVFLFPSLYEGLGIVLLEAQAAGNPCLISDVIPPEADVIKPLVERLSLSEPASSWAEKILHQKKSRLGISQAEAIRLVKQSPFNIKNSVNKMERLYLENYQHHFKV